MNPAPRRRLGLKVLGILVAAMGLVAAGSYASLRGAESRRWEQMEQALIALEAGGRPPGHRPVLYGEPGPGNGWDEYVQAVKFMQGKGPVWSLGQVAPKPDRRLVLDLIEKLAPALEYLRKGARCGAASRAVDWRREGSPMISWNHLSLLAAAQAREWTAAGRVRDAVELLLDGARMSADAGMDSDVMGFLISMAAVSHALDELKELMATEALGAEDLKLLDSALDRLDRSFPRVDSALTTGVQARGWELRRAPSLGDYVGRLCRDLQTKPPELRTWRFAFSDRLVIADYFEHHLEWSRRLAATADRPWSEAVAAARSVDQETGTSKNPLAMLWAPLDVSSWGHLSILSTARARRAQVRLLRIAGYWRATGEILDLDDPFDGKLPHELKEGRLKVWSRGRNGVDDGGTGEWHPAMGRDIVLELKK